MENIRKRPAELTRAELDIMQIVWQKGRVLIHDILDGMPEPRPAYNTVSTIVRILEQKGFICHKAYGRTHEYYPLVEREEYTENYMNGVLGNFFEGSLVQMMSFFTSRDNISIKEFDQIIGILEKVTSATEKENRNKICKLS
jgi:predicted transcriptional regulator